MIARPDPSRQFVFRPEPGLDLGEAIGRYCVSRGVDLAWVRAVGRLASVSLSSLGQTAHAGTDEAELVSLDGVLRAVGGVPVFHAYATIGVVLGGVSTVRAGALVSARVVEVEVLVTLAEDGAESRATAAAGEVVRARSDSPPSRPAPQAPVSTPASRPSAGPSASSSPPARVVAAPSAMVAPSQAPRPVMSPPAPATPVPPSIPSASSAPANPWAQVAEASRQVLEGADEDEEDIEVEDLPKNATLLHPALGACRFVRADRGDAILILVGDRGPTKKLAISQFRITREPDGRSFRLVKR